MKRILIVVAAMLLISSPAVLAEKPDPNVPNPPLQVKEWNVDGDGHIAVHEQGVVSVANEDGGELDVNVTGGSVEVSGGSIDANISGGSVDANVTNTVTVDGAVGVNNFPGQQGVWVDGGGLTPVTKAYYDYWGVDAGDITDYQLFSVGPILATLIYVSHNNDEVIVAFTSESLAPAGLHHILVIDDTAGQFSDHTITLPYPMEVDGFKIQCTNDSDKCNVHITVVGF